MRAPEVCDAPIFRVDVIVDGSIVFDVNVPPTNNLLEKETSDKTDNLLFIKTSPAEVIRPVNEGAARGAFDANEFVTVVENATSFPSAVANSLRVLRAPGAELIRALISPTTNAVVAICVVFVATSAVGALGTPVKVGPARFALRDNKLVNPVLTMDPPTNKLLEKDTSDDTDNLLFIETSLET